MSALTERLCGCRLSVELKNVILLCNPLDTPSETKGHQRESVRVDGTRKKSKHTYVLKPSIRDPWETSKDDQSILIVDRDRAYIVYGRKLMDERRGYQGQREADALKKKVGNLKRTNIGRRIRAQR